MFPFHLIIIFFAVVCLCNVPHWDYFSHIPHFFGGINYVGKSWLFGLPTPRIIVPAIAYWTQRKERRHQVIVGKEISYSSSFGLWKLWLYFLPLFACLLTFWFCEMQLYMPFILVFIPLCVFACVVLSLFDWLSTLLFGLYTLFILSKVYILEWNFEVVLCCCCCCALVCTREPTSALLPWAFSVAQPSPRWSGVFFAGWVALPLTSYCCFLFSNFGCLF